MSDVVFMGSPDFAVPALAKLVAAGYAVRAVYTQPDRPAGRGRRVAGSPVKVWAEAHGLAVVQPTGLRSSQAAAKLRELAPQAVVVAAYGKILPEAFLAVPPKGTLNIHPSLLPKYRGPSPVPSAILAGDDTTGVTIMLVDAGLDSGPVLAQRETPIGAGETAGALESRLANEGADLLVDTLAHWLRDEIRPVPQDASAVTVSRKLQKEDGRIDWDRSAAEIARQVRAMDPWPGAYTTWRGAPLKIVSAGLEPGHLGEAGAVVKLSDGRVCVATGEGVLVLERVQPAGRAQMTAREFLAGRHDFLGSKLPS